MNPQAAAVAEAEEEEKQQQIPCPRCNSPNTKFCYYNNYNLSQPRHLCKDCRRYWTKGGALRNIPIGGATRKIAKRSSTKRIATSGCSSPKPAEPRLPNDERSMLDISGSFTSLLEYSSNGRDQSLTPSQLENLWSFQADYSCWIGGWVG